MTRPICLLVLVAMRFHASLAGELFGEDKLPSREALIQTAVAELLKMQEGDGEWPYEGVYRVRREIPVGYHVGGTALVCEALVAAAPDSEEAMKAVERGVGCILKRLDDPLMAPSIQDTYDVRVWGHAYALELFCQLRAAKQMGKHAKQIEAWIPKLVKALIEEELPGGGWNYASRRQHAPFVTAPVTQALLLAAAQGEKVPRTVFRRCRKSLEGSRYASGAMAYSGPARAPRSDPNGSRTVLPGSIARSAVCETTLLLLGGGSTEAIQRSIDAFHEHWGELEKRRKKSGTHEPPYGVAPYYFYYGHRYAAQAIEALPAAARPKERDRLLETILRTRDEDGTWNDRVFARSRNYGTAMIVLALLGEKAPMVPAWKDARREQVAASQPSGDGAVGK